MIFIAYGFPVKSLEPAAIKNKYSKRELGEQNQKQKL